MSRHFLTFTDVTAEAGIKDSGYYGFGVVFSDFDNDGWPDIYVANDSVPNLLFHNKRDGTFEEVGLISGTSLNLFGQPQAGMGVAVGDYDGNGLFDIYVTNFVRRHQHALPQSRRHALFRRDSGVGRRARFPA